MRGRKWTWSEKILFLTPLLFVVAANWMFFAPGERVFRGDIWQRKVDGINFLRARESGGKRNFCPSNLNQISLGLTQYAMDNDEKFPLAASNGPFYGWAEAAFPYLKSTQIFRCPRDATKPTTSPRGNGYTSYYFNSRLSAKNRDASNAHQLILAGEGDDGIDIADARYSKKDWPWAWKTNRQSPLFRHLSEELWAEQGSFFLFADGHVKLVSPTSMGSGGWTFQAR